MTVYCYENQQVLFFLMVNIQHLEKTKVIKIEKSREFT